MTPKRKYAGYPIVAVGGVVIQDGRVLLIRRGKEPAAGQWSIPGGVLEVGESLAEGVTRELREETGIEIEVLGLIDVAERIFPASQEAGSRPANTPQYHYVILDYLCAAKEGTAHAGSDAAELAWSREDDLTRLDLHPEVTRILKKAFRMASA